jgi:hypothetical protein
MGPSLHHLSEDGQFLVGDIIRIVAAGVEQTSGKVAGSSLSTQTPCDAAG